MSNRNRKTRSTRKQRPYKMKGCFQKSRKKTLKGYLGGGNPFLAYIPKAYPSNGPPADGFNFLNPIKRGGGCGCAECKAGQYGGHGPSCMCAKCKSGQYGGSCGCGAPPMGGGAGMTYPNGLIGKPWGGAIEQWPGVDGVDGGRNHLGYNTYSPNDVSRQMKFVSASGGGRKRGSRKNKKTKAQKGGFVANDLIGLSKFGAGSFYNAIRGYPQPVSPLPWKDQLTKY